MEKWVTSERQVDGVTGVVWKFGVSLSNDSSPMKSEASPLSSSSTSSSPSSLPPPRLSRGLSARRTYLWTARGGIRKQGFCPQMRLSEMDGSVSERARTHACMCARQEGAKHSSPALDISCYCTVKCNYLLRQERMFASCAYWFSAFSPRQ